MAPIKTAKAKRPKYLFLRGSTYYYVRNIPARHRHRFPTIKGTQVWRSLETQNYSDAVQRLEVVTKSDDAVMHGDIPPLKKHTFEDAVSYADRNGYDYRSSGELYLQEIAASVREMATRLATTQFLSNPSQLEVAASAGAEQLPDVSISKATERFLEITPEYTHNLSDFDADAKIKRLGRSIADFIKRCGDIDILSVTDRVASEYHLSIKTDVTKKIFGSEHGIHLIADVRKVLKAVLKADYQRSFTAMDGMRINIKDAGKRSAFLESEVRKIIQELPTAKMNDEAKAIIQLALITGCGPKELCWLTSEDIHPHAKTPYIKIGPNSLRSFVKKGDDRHRDLPIVTPEGVEILKRYPNGFPSFQNGRGPLQLNRQMSPFFTTVTPGKSLYCARHRLDDLLKISGVDLGIKAAISGHSLGGHLHYYGKSGNGYTLKQKKEAIQKALAAASIKEEQENEH
ncbi:DUF6538 domain-containing protein [uncultured Agrobacterium sp.]|uniref:DUF6538 domain-containing protein n=1 Tax=uncultured Agrobacterium sp. TaxID=157277 RepID=UPI0025F1AED1|nr:DUF6538 domain-containing protein [uncultured Agrobacterium sp.]